MTGTEDTPDLLVRVPSHCLVSVRGATIATMTQCAVQRRPNGATTAHTLHERAEWADATINVGVCEAHDLELSDPDTEWIFETDENPLVGGSQSVLLVGDSLRGLNEYVVKEIAEVRGGYTALGRQLSHKSDDGYHFTFEARQRGNKDAAPVTLVLDKEALTELASLLKTFGAS
ncbi:hypothetical protein [Nocardia fluminea]|uniref:hypothetical protein n=1 Tax=Nocardia fluminea TaxID=134984 RepID=UPI00364E8E3B